MTGCLLQYITNHAGLLINKQLTRPVNIPMAPVTNHLTTSCPHSDYHVKYKTPF